MEDDTPRPPPLPLDATAWEAEAHRVTMDFWQFNRLRRQRGEEPMPLEKFVALSAAQKATGLAKWRVDWDALWNAPSQPEWLLEPLIATGRAHALYAGAKTGKSYLMLPAAAALATGRAFLHQPAGQSVDVVYMDYEMTEDDLRDRLEEFGYGPQDDLSHLHYILLPIIPGLDTIDGAKFVVGYCEQTKARLVVIDTTARAVEGLENESNTYNNFYQCTGIALKSRGIAWVRLDHAGKDITRGQRGSSGKNDDVDVVWQLVKKDQGNELVATHRRMSWVPERIDLTIKETEMVKAWNTTEHLWPAGTREAADLLDKLAVPVESSVRDARMAIRLAGEKCAQNVLTAAVRWRRQMSDLGELSQLVTPLVTPSAASNVTPIRNA